MRARRHKIIAVLFFGLVLMNVAGYLVVYYSDSTKIIRLAEEIDGVESAVVLGHGDIKYEPSALILTLENGGQITFSPVEISDFKGGDEDLFLSGIDRYKIHVREYPSNLTEFTGPALREIDGIDIANDLLRPKMDNIVVNSITDAVVQYDILLEIVSKWKEESPLEIMIDPYGTKMLILSVE